MNPSQQHPDAIAAFFDLDKTIIATSSALAYGREFLQSGLISPAEAFQMSLVKASYMFAGHSHEQMDATRDQLVSLVRGWDVRQVQDIAAQALQEVVSPTIYAEARTLIETHRQAGHIVVIISASAEELVRPIAAELGIEHFVATRLGKAKGKFDGSVEFYCKGDNKAAAMRTFAAKHNIDLERSYAYSDSATDQPMLEAAGLPRAVNPDRTLKKLATERGWEILSFKNPVPLFPRPSGKELGITTGVVAVLGALGAGIWWLNSRGSKT